VGSNPITPAKFSG